ncbi:radical SAM protein [Pseudodesulfovibrio sp.]|uniref:radical SAM/SPASM domain-containing protein n=1 Tax=Pseudodesulfovibrio sp. TaxID=2035812 RepID=UPI00261CAE59|nr:radical SAM protein [Pseudodesulfovibrio sp.]MDD3312410.1 radical SAM protein [Pseudodesulfovibrio sp.]
MSWVYDGKSLKAFTNALYVSAMRRLRRNPDHGHPFVLYCEPTSFCNLRCPACPTGTRRSGLERASRDLAGFKTLLDEAGDYLFSLYFYNWGEPLLHPELPEMVAHAHGKGILCYVSSNLSMPLSDDYCRRLMASGLFQLKVGVDGATQEGHAAYRVGSNLETVKDNLRRLVAIKRASGGQGPRINVRFHVFAHNEHEIARCAEDMRAIGVDSFAASPSDLPPGSEPPADPRYRKSEQTARQLAALRERGDAAPCSWLYDAAVVNPNWSVFPCCSAPSESFSFGRVTPVPGRAGSSLAEVWRNGSYRRARACFRAENLPGWLERVLPGANDGTDGMCLSRAGARDAALLCEHCPTPYILERFSGDVVRLSRIFWNRAVKYLREGDPRMGGMFVRAALLGLARCIAPRIPGNKD